MFFNDYSLKKLPQYVFIDTLSLIFIHLKLSPKLSVRRKILTNLQNILAALDYKATELKITILKCLITANDLQKGLLDEKMFTWIRYSLLDNVCDNVLCKGVLKLSYTDFTSISKLFPDTSSIVSIVLNRSSLAAKIIENKEQKLKECQMWIFLPGFI